MKKGTEQCHFITGNHLVHDCYHLVLNWFWKFSFTPTTSLNGHRVTNFPLPSFLDYMQLNSSLSSFVSLYVMRRVVCDIFGKANIKSILRRFVNCFSKGMAIKVNFDLGQRNCKTKSQPPLHFLR